MAETPVKFVIRVYFETIGEFIENYGPHVTEGGMTLMLTKELKVDDLVGIEFKLKSEYPLIQGRARVVEVQPEGKGYRVQVQFLELDEKSRQVLQQAIKMSSASKSASSSTAPPQDKGALSPPEDEEIADLSEELLDEREEAIEKAKGGPISLEEETIFAEEEAVEEIAEEGFEVGEQSQEVSEGKQEEERSSRERSTRRISPLLWGAVGILLLGGGALLWFFLLPSSRPPLPAPTPSQALPTPTPTTTPTPTPPSPHPPLPQTATSSPLTHPSPSTPTSPPSPPPSSLPPPSPPSPLPPATRIVRLETTANGIEVHLNGLLTPSQVRTFSMKAPDRFVVDLKGIALPRGLKVGKTDPPILKVRTGEHPGYTRLVLDLRSPHRFRTRIEGNTLWIEGTP